MKEIQGRSMAISYICVLISSLMPIIWVGVAKMNLGFNLEKNRNPREVLASCSGLAQRANWAQANSWEAFAPFAAAIIIAHQVGVNQASIDSCAIAFVVFRFLYGVCYLLDWANMRSIVWFGGMIAVFRLYYLVAMVS